MKRIFLVIVIFTFFFSSALYSLYLDFSISYQPFVFSYIFTFLLDSDDSDRVNMVLHEPGQFTVYQAALKHRSGFNLGFGVSYDSGYRENDNVVGYFSDVLAWLGFKQFTIKTTFFSQPFIAIFPLSGIAQEQERIREFTSKRTTVELFWNPHNRRGKPSEYYFGIYYQNADFPKIIERGGRYFFTNDRVSFPSYGIVFRVDTFSHLMDTSESGIFPWAEAWLYAGVGEWDFSDKVDTIQIGQFPIDYRLNSIFGALIILGEKRKISAAIGYHSELDWFILRHGFIMRAGIRL